MRPKLIVFASGTKDGGGSGFENLVHHSYEGDLDAEIVAVVSNNASGGVRRRAEQLSVPFVYFNPDDYSDILDEPGMFTDGKRLSYTDIVKETGAEWIALSGWLKLVKGLDPARTFNIHPALLSQLGGRFGGKGMYGDNIHIAVSDALSKGEITTSGPSMHFVTEEYDRGPVFFEYPIPVKKKMKALDVAKAVNLIEHEWQPKITNMVVHGEISWNGKSLKSLKVPKGYEHLPKQGV